jgi:hypothetical protein
MLWFRGPTCHVSGRGRSHKGLKLRGKTGEIEAHQARAIRGLCFRQQVGCLGQESRCRSWSAEIELEAAVGELDQGRHEMALATVRLGGEPNGLPDLVCLPEIPLVVKRNAMPIGQHLRPVAGVDFGRTLRAHGSERCPVRLCTRTGAVPRAGKSENRHDPAPAQSGVPLRSGVAPPGGLPGLLPSRSFILSRNFLNMRSR